MCELGLVRICLGLLSELFVRLGLYSGVFRSLFLKFLFKQPIRKSGCQMLINYIIFEYPKKVFSNNAIHLYRLLKAKIKLNSRKLIRR